MRQRRGSGGAGEAHMKSQLTDCHSSSTPYSRGCVQRTLILSYFLSGTRCLSALRPLAHHNAPLIWAAF